MYPIKYFRPYFSQMNLDLCFIRNTNTLLNKVLCFEESKQ